MLHAADVDRNANRDRLGTDPSLLSSRNGLGKPFAMPGQRVEESLGPFSDICSKNATR